MSRRPEATRGAAFAVAAWQAGIAFEAVREDGSLEGLEWSGPGRETAAYMALLAETRARQCDFKELLRRHPEAWTAAAETLGLANPAPDEAWRPAAVAALNAPRVWAHVQAVAGALLARQRVSAAQVAEIRERMFTLRGPGETEAWSGVAAGAPGSPPRGARRPPPDRECP